MMTQNQAFDVINDSPASGEVNLQQYVGRTYVLYKHAEASRKLQRGTINILEVSFHLDEQKRVLKRKAYKELLASLDLEGEDKNYLKVGAAFSSFDPADLALVEPSTIFLLAKNSKKYQPVIEQLKNETNITQKRVRELMSDCRKSRSQKSDNVSVWRRTQKGARYCQIGPIHEEDEFTGVTIQRIVEEKNVLPQTVVRNAMSLVEAYYKGQLVWVNNSQELNSVCEENFFDVKENNTSNGIEAPVVSFPLIDSKSQFIETDNFCDSTLEDKSHIINLVGDSNLTLSSDFNSNETLNIPVTKSEIVEVIAESEVSDDTNNSSESESIADNKEISESVLELSCGANSELEQEAFIIAEYLQERKTWSEVVNVMQNCPDDLKSLSWKLLDKEQKARLHELKSEFEVNNTDVATREEISNTSSNQESENNLKVGDKVMWDNCYPHLQSWQPFIITKIEGKEARLDYYTNSVPLKELSLVE